MMTKSLNLLIYWVLLPQWRLKRRMTVQYRVFSLNATGVIYETALDRNSLLLSIRLSQLALDVSARRASVSKHGFLTPGVY